MSEAGRLIDCRKNHYRVMRDANCRYCAMIRRADVVEYAQTLDFLCDQFLTEHTRREAAERLLFDLIKLSPRSHPDKVHEVQVKARILLIPAPEPELVKPPRPGFPSPTATGERE